MDFTAPLTTTAPLLSPRGARTRSARVLPGSRAPSQPGAAGSGEGSRAFIPAIRGWLIGFFCGIFFFLFFLVCCIDSSCVSHEESSSVNKKQNVTWADGNGPKPWQDLSPSRSSVPRGLRPGASVLWLSSGICRKEGMKGTDISGLFLLGVGAVTVLSWGNGGTQAAPVWLNRIL